MNLSAHEHPGHVHLHSDMDTIFCSPLEMATSTSGIWFGHDPFVRSYSVYIAQLILVSLFSQFLRVILRPLKQTKFVSWTLAGIALGPCGLGRWIALREKLFPPSHQLLANTTATLGITLFTFLCAVKTDTGMLPKLAKNALVISGMSALLASTVVTAMVETLDHHYAHNHLSVVFLAGSTSMTRFQNLSVALDEMQVLTSPLGRLALTVSISNEIIPWTFVILTDIFRAESTVMSFGAAISSLLIVVFTVFVARPFMLSIIKKTPHGRPVKDEYVMRIMIGTMMMVLLSQAFGLMSVGVIFLGLVIPAGPPLGSAVIEKMELVVMEVFMPLLYVAVGYRTDFSKIVDWECFRLIMIILATGLFTKIIAAILSATLLCKLDLRSSCLLATMMSINGPLDIYLLLLRMQMKVLDYEGYTAAVICYVVATAIATPLIQVFYNINVRSKELFEGAKIRTIQDTPNNVEFSALCCIHTEDNVPEIVTIINAFTSATTTEKNLSTFVLVHLVELVGSSVPIVVPYKENRKAKRLSTYYIMKAFENYWNRVNRAVEFESFQIIAPYKTMHESICQLAIDKSVPVIIVPLYDQKKEANPVAGTSSRNLITNLQEKSNCTIGILVEKESHHQRRILDNDCRIVVIFIGGADDREGLMLAARMSRHSGVSITLLHIILPTPESEGKNDMIDRVLNDAIIDQFKAENVGQTDRDVVCNEVKVKDIEEAFNAIRAIEDNYDLIVVGKEHRTMYPDEMLNWIENPELGVVGDLLASEALHRNTTMLLLQHPKKARDAITGHSDENLKLRYKACNNGNIV